MEEFLDNPNADGALMHKGMSLIAKAAQQAEEFSPPSGSEDAHGKLLEGLRHWVLACDVFADTSIPDEEAEPLFISEWAAGHAATEAAAILCQGASGSPPRTATAFSA